MSHSHTFMHFLNSLRTILTNVSLTQISLIIFKGHSRSRLLAVSSRSPNSHPAHGRRAGQNSPKNWLDSLSSNRKIRWKQKESRVSINTWWLLNYLIAYQSRLTISHNHLSFQMCDMYGGIFDPRWYKVSPVHAHLPHSLYRRLANAIIHMSILYGACGRRTPFIMHFW